MRLHGGSCWYCSRFGLRLLPIELQRHFLPLYPTVGPDGQFTPFARRWEETLAGGGQAYISDASLVSSTITAAYARQAAAAGAETATGEPSEALTASLAKQTLLEPTSIRSLFRKHHAHAERANRWEQPHRAAGDGDSPAVVMDNDALRYDASLVGRRCTALWSPPEGEDGSEDYYAATIVAFNPRAAAHKGQFLLHFDDGLRERVESVRIMSTRVSKCRCLHSPGGAVGCCAGVDGSEPLPRPWEANPM